jgi:hypothetical protein
MSFPAQDPDWSLGRSSAPDPLHSNQPRRVRLVLRDQRVVDGYVHLGGSGDLATFLATREGGWVNLTGVVWRAAGERARHVVLQGNLVLWAGALDGETALGPPTFADDARPVEVMLENRVTLHASLQAASSERLTDILMAWGQFIPMRDARLAGADIGFGDIAVNREAIHLLQDRPRAPADAAEQFEGDDMPWRADDDPGAFTDPF